MEPFVLGIDHVQLAAPAGCEAQARYFFGDLLGLVEIEKPEKLRSRGGVWFLCGAQQLHIGVETEFAPAKKAHPAFRVNDLDKVRKELSDHGFETIEDRLSGVRRCHAFDPFGNRLEFVEEK